MNNSDQISVDIPGLFRSDGSIGGLVRNETSVLSDGEYFANANIIISDGASLVIGDNSNITFTPDRGIIVKNTGKLTIDANDAPAMMSSSSPSEDWAGIHIRNVNETYINGALITMAEVGVDMTSTGSITIHNSFINVTSDGIRLEDNSRTSALDVSHVYIDSDNYGINAYNYRGFISIHNSTMTNRYGLRSRYAEAVELIDNVLETNDVAIYISQPGSNTTIRGNNLSCKRECLHIWSNRQSSVESNTFSGTGYLSSNRQIYVRNDISQSDSFHLQDNSFGNWRSSASYDAVYVDVNQCSGGTGAVSLSNNRFHNITAKTIFNLHFRSSAAPVSVANIFDSNLEAIDSTRPAVFSIEHWPESCGAGSCDIVGNIFNYSLPTGQKHLTVSVDSRTVPTINAALSYWGTSNESDVIESIYDGRDDAELSTIQYLPYLLTSDSAGATR